MRAVMPRELKWRYSSGSIYMKGKSSEQAKRLHSPTYDFETLVHENASMLDAAQLGRHVLGTVLEQELAKRVVRVFLGHHIEKRRANHIHALHITMTPHSQYIHARLYHTSR
jgi:hypothetical protein